MANRISHIYKQTQDFLINMTTQFVNRPEGNFQFVPAHGVYCSDVVPMSGYTLAHATFAQPVPIALAFEQIARYLASIGRPTQAACGFQLRVPEAFTQDGFDTFNQTYIKLLMQHGWRDAERAFATRSNVAPELAASKPKEASIAGFTFTVPGARPNGRQAFVLSGLTEKVKADNSPQGMREKARSVMQALNARLPTLGATWSDATAINMYTIYNPMSFIESEVLSVIGVQAAHGINWQFSRPPISGIDFEVDVRGVSQELSL